MLGFGKYKTYLVTSLWVSFLATRNEASFLIAALTIAARSSRLKNHGRYICAFVTEIPESPRIASFTPSGNGSFVVSISFLWTVPGRIEPRPSTCTNPVDPSPPPEPPPPGITTCTKGDENTGVSTGTFDGPKKESVSLVCNVYE